MNRQKTTLLCDLLEFGCSCNYSVFFLGDFNFPRIDWNDRVSHGGPEHFRFMNCCLRLNLAQLVTEPTRDDNILDLILCSHSSTVSSLSVDCPFTTTCDHNSVSFSLLFLGHNTVKCNDVYRDFHNADYTSIRHILSHVDWYHMYNQCSTVNSFWEGIRSVILEIFEDANLVPKYPLRSHRHSRRYPKYIRKLLAKKKKLYPRRKKNYEFMHSYKLASVAYTKAVSDYLQHLESSLVDKNNIKSFFSYANSKLRCKVEIPPLVDDNGNIITDNQEKAELFNQVFANVFTSDNGQFPHFVDVVPPSVSLNHVCFPIEVIIKKLLALPRKFSKTPDEIPPIFLLNVAHEIAFPLQLLFELSFMNGEIPNDWKSGIIVPFFKRGNSSSPNNYRPVSLTCVCCKVMESIIVDCIFDYVSAQGLICDSQSGFVRRRSISTQLIQVFNEWTEALNNHHQIDSIYIDFAKAFDSVCHQKLLKKLKAYGLRYELLNWITSFLTNRTQSVCVDNNFSSRTILSSGVLQGSVLGPCLFLMYINDIVYCIKDGCSIHLFADDAKIYEIRDNVTTSTSLIGSLQSISEWANNWQLTISHSKCEHLYLGNSPYCHSFHLDGHVIKSVFKVCDLGIHTDNKLKFTCHYDRITSNAYSRAFLILKSFVSNDPSLLIRAYCVYVRPILEFCTQLWNPRMKKDIIKIERVQKFFTRKVCKRARVLYTDYSSRLSCLNLESLEKRRLIFDLIFVYKMLNNLIDIPLQPFFTISTSSTRGHSRKLLVSGNINSNVRGNFFSYRIIHVWNSLPESVVCASSVDLFKRLIRRVDLSQFCVVYS